MSGAGRRTVLRAGVLLPLSCLVACAVSAGVAMVGPDTYAASEMRAPALGGGFEARRAVLAEADTFCRQQNRAMLLLVLQADGDPFTPYFPTAFDATFRCVTPALSQGATR